MFRVRKCDNGNREWEYRVHLEYAPAFKRVCPNYDLGWCRVIGHRYKSAKRSFAVFLTGVTGFLGGAFLANLLDSSFDEEVICLVRAEDQETAEERAGRSVARFGSRSRLPRNVKILRGDLLSNEWHEASALGGVSHVLHLAASTSFGNHHGIRTTNVDGALSVAKAMRSSG